MQNPVFGYPLSKENVMLCYKERHPLLLDYFIPFLNWIRMVGRATSSLYESLMVHNMSFLPISNIKFHVTVRFNFEYPLSTGNVLLCCKERYSLLMKCFITFLRCMKMVERASDSIYEPLKVHILVLFLPITNLKFHAKSSLRVPSQQRKCDAVLQGETPIATWLLHTIPELN